MDFKNSLAQFKKMFLRFWRSEDTKISLVRDILVAFFFVFIILMAMWIYTGQWFGTPMVSIESGSMMHEDEPFGRLGTIDAGDMVLLVKVNNKNDVNPYGTSNEINYGKKGDVIVYHPNGDFDTDQIIHRAMCWIEVGYTDDNKVYTIEGTDIIKQNASIPIYLPEYGILSLTGNKSIRLNFEHSGFITKGDNPQTNSRCDQIGGISSQPIKLEWISGKASLELPWIGIINLLFNDLTTNDNTLSNVPQDSVYCFIILIAFLISIPVSMDIYGYYKEKKQKN
jgi:signal peptidase